MSDLPAAGCDTLASEFEHAAEEGQPGAQSYLRHGENTRVNASQRR